ncbi:transporter [Luteolibacter yonseiensis]|uniref:Transporter n=1 Tax=Luteolibacter yonseiensis TaxID=1144680 RepID=A0A934R1W1_9BACT|nr:transporter [Luteolibacter yonseiensis]MBK1814603.1 transporter [Luteolibacter yonseiensis]
MNPLHLLACGLSAASVSAAELRPLSTDRPDTTESPRTVDAGHFQFEMEVANASHDGFSLAELNSKIGLDASTDLQVVTPFYTRVRDGGEGFGDVEIRLKRNLWGNDSGSTALAIMPFVKIPTANGDLGNDEFEGGLIVPFGFDGPSGWSCAVMAELDLVADDDGGGHHLVGVASATTSHGITENTAIFLELVSVADAGSRSAYEAYFNTGMTWAVTSTCQLDGGIRLGLTDASADFTPFLGASTKF